MANVLVVDDEPDILLLHRLNLEAAGHVVVPERESSKAQDILRAHGHRGAMQVGTITEGHGDVHLTGR